MFQWCFRLTKFTKFNESSALFRENPNISDKGIVSVHLKFSPDVSHTLSSPLLPENVEIWNLISFGLRKKSWKPHLLHPALPENMEIWDSDSFELRNKGWKPTYYTFSPHQKLCVGQHFFKLNFMHQCTFRT